MDNKKRNVPLTEDEIKAAKPAEKLYKLSDQFRLYLAIAPSGSKTWRWGYRLFNPAKGVDDQYEVTLGQYPDVKLAAARKLRAKAAEYVERGEHPPQHKSVKNTAKTTAVEAHKGPRVHEVVDEWVTFAGGEWSERYRTLIADSLAIRCGKDTAFGQKLFATVTTDDIETLYGTMADTPAMAKLVRGWLRKVFARGKSRKLIATNPTDEADFNNKVAPSKTRNHPPIPPAVLKELLLKIRSYPGERTTAILLEWLARTAVRTVEAREATWSEIHLASREWIIPKERIKTRIEHVVPLVPQTLKLLDELREIGGDKGWLMPSATLGDDGKPQPIDRATPIDAMYKLTGKAFSPHCFRSTFSTECNNAELDWRVIETALAHKKPGVGGVYDKSTHIKSRRKLMTTWNDYLDWLMENDPLPLRNWLYPEESDD